MRGRGLRPTHCLGVGPSKATTTSEIRVAHPQARASHEAHPCLQKLLGHQSSCCAASCLACRKGASCCIPLPLSTPTTPFFRDLMNFYVPHPPPPPTPQKKKKGARANDRLSFIWGGRQERSGNTAKGSLQGLKEFVCDAGLVLCPWASACVH